MQANQMRYKAVSEVFGGFKEIKDEPRALLIGQLLEGVIPEVLIFDELPAI